MGVDLSTLNNILSGGGDPLVALYRSLTEGMGSDVRNTENGSKRPYLIFFVKIQIDNKFIELFS